MNPNFKFWEHGDYKNSCLSRVDLPCEIIEKVSDWSKNPKGMLVFLGNPGVGKTYLIAAFIHLLLETKNFHFRYLHERDLYARMRDCVEKGWNYERDIETICETKWIFLDDIHSGQSTEFQKEVLLSFVDKRGITNLPTIITSNLFLDELGKQYSSRLISRIKDKKNLVIELNWIDKRQQ